MNYELRIVGKADEELNNYELERISAVIIHN